MIQSEIEMRLIY